MTTQSTAPDLATLVGDLKDLLTSAAPYVAADSPLADVEGFLGDVASALGAVGTIDTTVQDLSALVEAAAAVTDALDGVPFVDIVVAPASAVFDAAGGFLSDASSFLDEAKATVEPVRVTVVDLDTGIKDVQQVLEELTVQVPQYLNTVQILDYLLQIAGTLVPFLEGSEPGDRLAAVVDTLNTVLDDVGTAFGAFEQAMSPVFAGLETVVGVIEDVADGMGQGVQDTLHAFESAADALSPVASGFRKVENAIGPLRWVLDAIAWIVDHVLKPAIDWVLKATGLSTLLDGLEAKVEGWLGITSLKSAVGQAGAQQGGLSSGQQAAGSATGQQAGSTYTSFGSSMSQFRQGDDSTLKSVASELLGAITGAGLSDGTGGLPDFPVCAPDLTGNGGGSTAVRAPALGALRTAPQRMALVSPLHPDHPRTVPVSLAQVRAGGPAALAGATTAGPWPVAPVDPAVWPRTAAMVAGAGDLTGRLGKIGPDATALASALTAFRQSADLPATFAAGLGQFGATFDVCSDLLTSLTAFDLAFLTALVDPVEALVAQQATDVKACVTTLPDALRAIAAVEQAVTADVADLPTAATLADAVHRADGWVLGAEQLVATMDAIHQQLTTQGTDLTGWTSAHDQIETAAQSVAARQATLATTLDAVEAGVTGLSAALHTYATALAPVTEDARGLVGAVPAAGHVARILGVVQSLVDPLQGLFHLACPTSGTTRAMAGSLVDDLTELATTLTTPPPGQVNSLLAQLDAQALPCGRLAAALTAATTTLTGTVVPDVTAQASALAAALHDLADGLAQQDSYTMTDKATGQAVTVANDLVSQQVVDQLQEVIAGLDPQ
ncbi:hypothetical protein ATJ88_1828 [Isoptericola jiangsuensis]|uniref:Uncharacterized protein n=1 Tax=Isoptericola jiangsuensis TaxID=548579 RepID=A0A2A9EVU3_9MICO|nr:hypothetical protein [Isoptericola jiangsuensis]PFG43144.1 hypothetical protein ATJ88_1828 [Isoptericola jiangsuensis]